MAYTNPYFPYTSGYNQLTAYPTYNPSSQTAVPLTSNTVSNSILTIFIDKEEDVTDYPVAAGTSVMLISFKLGKFYLKSTANNGVPQPTRVFSFKEEAAPVNNPVGSVTREEFNALNDKLSKLIEELGGAK